MLDLFSILENYISSSLSISLLLIVAAFWMSSSGKWKEYFFTYKGFVGAVILILAAVICFLEMPEIKYQKIVRSGIAVAVTVYLIYLLYGRNHIVFPKNLLIKKWRKIYKWKDTWRYRLAYMLLSPYESIWVTLEEAKYIYQEQPYEAYCKLKELDVSGCEAELQVTYDQLRGASLLGMGAYSEAKTILEKLKAQDENNLTTLSELCTVYERSDKKKEAMELAERAYQIMIAERTKPDVDLMAQIYHNYACYLIAAKQINRGLDVAKEAADMVLQEKKGASLHLIVGDYLKLLTQYRRDDAKVLEYWQRYECKLSDDRDMCFPYINTKLYLLQMGFPLGDMGEYLTYVYKVNKDKNGVEGKCFTCLSCMSVSFAHNINIEWFLKEMIEVMKEYCPKLDMMKRLRFYDGLSFIADKYLVQCASNSFEESEHFGEFLHLYHDYTKNHKENEVREMLEKTESIWVNQKIELRTMMLYIQKQKPYDFESIYAQYAEIYKDWQFSNNLHSMLDTDINIIQECIAPENIENVRVQAKDMRSKQKEVLIRHLQDAERLLTRINHEYIWAEYAIKLSKGYIFAGDTENAARFLAVFEAAKIPVSYLPEWEREDYRIIKRTVDSEIMLSK